MKIAGFIKQSFIDYPGKIASVIFTAGCNLRCPYCHNPQLIQPNDHLQTYSEQTVLEYIKKNESLLDALVITGGEPFMNPDLISFLREVRNTSLQIKVDTNGTFPDRLKEAMDLHLVDYIAMDIKQSLHLDKYRDASGCLTQEQFEKIKQSIYLLKQAKIEFEFRTTIVDGIHTLQDLKEIAVATATLKKWFLQNFRNENVISQKKMKSFTSFEMDIFLEDLKKLHAGVCIQ